MTTYNGEKHIAQQLESLSKQTYSNIEIIICDDGSSDNTIDIIQAKQKIDKRIKFFFNDNTLGIMKNFEKAITLCKGDYIALCDQDDIWDQDKISKLVKHIGDSKLIYHDDTLINTSGDVIAPSYYRHMKYTPQRHLRDFYFYTSIAGHTMMFRKELIDDLLPIHEKSEFYDWWISVIAAKSGSIKYLDMPLVKWRIHGQNTAQTQHKERSKSILQALLSQIDAPTWSKWSKARIDKLKVLQEHTLFKSDPFIEKAINYHAASNRITAFWLAIRYIRHIAIQKSLLKKMKYIMLPFFAPKVKY
jgi:glycosyltransferase involved in cell wall biosynthesis